MSTTQVLPRSSLPNSAKASSGSSKQDSTKVERGSVPANQQCTGEMGSKPPALEVPKEISYSMTRWLDQHPDEEPWEPYSKRNVLLMQDENFSTNVSGTATGNHARGIPHPKNHG